MKFLFLSFSLLISTGLFANVHFENSSEKGETRFLAVGKPAMIKIRGTTMAPKTKVTMEKSSLKVESILLLESLNTGIDLRDEHMKEKYLQTKEYPTAKLNIDSIALPAGFEQSYVAINDQPFTGKLLLHGKEQIIEGLFSLNTDLELTANFSIKLTNFGIEIPTYLGINVADNVFIETKFKLVKSN